MGLGHVGTFLDTLGFPRHLARTRYSTPLEALRMPGISPQPPLLQSPLAPAMKTLLLMQASTLPPAAKAATMTVLLAVMTATRPPLAAEVATT